MSSAAPAKDNLSKTILVVEEEEGIRSLLQLALSAAGFKVLLQSNGRDAVKLYRNHTSAIHLVLLDVRMEGLDGPGTLALLRQIDNQVRCCFMTGDTSADREQELLALGGLHVFRKPFSSLTDLTDRLWSFVDS
jgi:DNA-binding response OmpR family regulator